MNFNPDQAFLGLNERTLRALCEGTELHIRNVFSLLLREGKHEENIRTAIRKLISQWYHGWLSADHPELIHLNPAQLLRCASNPNLFRPITRADIRLRLQVDSSTLSSAIAEICQQYLPYQSLYLLVSPDGGQIRISLTYGDITTRNGEMLRDEMKDTVALEQKVRDIAILSSSAPPSSLVKLLSELCTKGVSQQDLVRIDLPDFPMIQSTLCLSKQP